jgi:hypothetical protein
MTTASTPHLEAAAGRLTLSRSLMPVLMRLHSGRDADLTFDDVEALEAATIVTEGMLHPVADAILATMTDPELVATIERTSIGLPPWLGTVWGRGAMGVVGESPAPDMFTLSQTQRGLIPFHVANLVGVGPRPAPGHHNTVVVETALLAASRPHWDTPHVMGEMLADHAVPVGAARALAAAHASRLASWRVTCLRTHPDGTPSDGEILILDGGDGGYWSLVADIDAPGTVTFTPLRWPFVIDLIGDLFPTG